jgi:phosphoglycolate phosphatase
MNRELQAIIFDFDGTLARLNIDFPMMRRALADLIASYGVPAADISQLLVLEMIETGRQWLAARDGARSAEFNERTAQLVYDIEMEGARTGELIPGVREMLAGLRQRGIEPGVLTRNCLEAVLVTFPDINDYCRAVITREATPKVKPDPEHLRIALERLEAQPGNAAMVGDHPMDIEVGKRLGAMTIGVLTGYYNREGLEQSGADLIIDSAANILEHI